MDTGNEKVKLENENIVSIVEEATLSAVPYAEKGKIEIIFDTVEEEIILACDKEKIKRIILNLLSNAIKFTPKDGKIEVNIGLKDDTVIITVEDTGVGIPKEKCNVIFERFIQVDTSLRRRCEGSGIGLSIVKHMVELHSGEIGVYSEEGKGSIFTVELPIRVLGDGTLKDRKHLELKDRIDQAKIELSDIYYD